MILNPSYPLSHVHLHFPIPQFIIYFICLSGASAQVFLIRESYNQRQITVEDIQRVNRPFDRENQLNYGHVNDSDYSRLILASLYGYYSNSLVHDLSLQFSTQLGLDLTKSALKRSLSLARSNNLSSSSSQQQSLLLLTSFASQASEAASIAVHA